MKVVDKGRKGKHLNKCERGQIAAYHEAGYSAYKIGKILGRSADTIRNELNRGTTTTIKRDGFTEQTKYYPDTGQAVYEKNRKKCKGRYKAAECKEFLEYIETEVLEKKRSFDAARGYALKNGLFTKEEVVCVTTLYTYAEKGIIGVHNIDLPEKISRRTKKKGTHARRHKRLQGRSIEERPESVNDKKEFGHWEIDLVIGKKSDDNALLTLTERKTKKELVEKIGAKTMKEVMKGLQRIERRMPHFDEVFKTITTDNGTEFSKLYELENGRRVRVYYAHPYSSWERGLNENTNKIIRRFVPKGKAVKNYSRKKISEIEDWINTLPRRILGYRTAEERFQEEIELLLMNDCV